MGEIHVPNQVRYRDTAYVQLRGLGVRRVHGEPGKARVKGREAH